MRSLARTILGSAVCARVLEYPGKRASEHLVLHVIFDCLLFPTLQEDDDDTVNDIVQIMHAQIRSDPRVLGYVCLCVCLGVFARITALVGCAWLCPHFTDDDDTLCVCCCRLARRMCKSCFPMKASTTEKWSGASCRQKVMTKTGSS